MRFTPHDIEFLLAENDKKPTTPPSGTVSEYVEGKRILPPSTPFPGFWQNWRTPYLVEIMDCMSPFNPIQHVALMKGAQVGATAAAENVLAYWMDESPAEILFISATQALIERWATKRLEPLIDSCGIREKIFSQSENKKTRKSGDRTFMKEFVGGALDMASAQSAPSLRSDTKRILIRDEIDGCPSELKTGEGNWLEVSYARTFGWEDRKKIFDFSTPALLDDSLIHTQFMHGDQRLFHIPCPHCGKFQPLEWSTERGTNGMRGDTVAGKLDKVYYLCDFCHDAIFNHHKSMFLHKGVWVPHAKSNDPYFRSYHLSSLYAPVGMLSWEKIWAKHKTAKKSPEGMRSFTNLYLGEAYKETGTKPKLEKMIELRSGYQEGTVPDGVLFLTAAIDVQRGSAKDPENPPRLEMEICGHGLAFKTYSITYRRFEGPTDDISAGAWAKLDEYARETELTFTRSIDGRKFDVKLVLIDSGDGETTTDVYDFCQTWKATFPSKGFQSVARKKHDRDDEVTEQNFRRFRRVNVSDDIWLHEISTNFYKSRTYTNLKKERVANGPQKPGFCAFPLQYGEKYFAMLTAEDRLANGNFSNRAQRRNEALDCRVMNLCAGDAYLQQQVEDGKLAARQAGLTQAQIMQMNHAFVLRKMQEATRVQR